MKGYIGIIAPLIDRSQYHANFNLRFRNNRRELTLAAFYEFAQKGFDVSKLSRGIDYEENIPSAGYYLEGLLRQYDYDTILTNKFDSESLEKIASKNPVAVLVSTTMIITASSLFDLFSAIRKAMPETIIIAGGVLVWKNYLIHRNREMAGLKDHEPDWMLFNSEANHVHADVYVAAPHGRSSLMQVLEEIGKGQKASFDDIPNLVIPHKNGFHFTKRIEEKVDYNTDYTRWDLIENITTKIPLRTSIGCPYRCMFCDFYQLFPKIFLRSPESLAAELKLVRERLGRTPGIIHVSDDNVFINKKRVEEVCTVIAKSGLRRWIGFMRADEYTDHELELIQQSGLMLGLMGIESGDQGQLDRMNKKQDLAKVKRGIEQLDAHSISTLMTFIAGFPGETEETVNNTISFMNKLDLTTHSTSYDLFPLLVKPLSRLWDEKKQAEWGLSGYMDHWNHNTMDSEEGIRQIYRIFREVINVPYHYFEESEFFNKAKFDTLTRHRLYMLRQQLTTQYFDHSDDDSIISTIKEMTQLMKLQPENLSSEAVREIYI